MRKFFSILIVCLFALLCVQNVLAGNVQQQNSSEKPLNLWVPYDPEKSDDLNNLDNKYIFIQEKDLEEIKNSTNPEQDESGDPPVSYQITSATYSIDAQNNSLKIKGVYKINKLDDEWVLIPVISDKTGISSAQIDGNKAFIVNKPEKLVNRNDFKNYNTVIRGYKYLVVKNKGSYVLTLDFTEDVRNIPSQNTKSLAFNIPKMPITNVECNFSEKDLAVQVPNAVSVKTVKNVPGTKIIASLPPTELVEVNWTPKSKVSHVTKLPPSVSAVTYSKLEMGRGTLKGTFNADIDIRRSSLSKFDFYVPKDIEIDSVSAKDNELIDPYPDVKGNILSLELVSPVEGKVEFVINYRKNFDDSSFETQIPAITLVNDNIDRETGFVAAVETTNIESSIVKTDKSKNYKEIDSKELQGNLSGTKASIALKYTKNKENAKETPYDITIKVVKHKDVAVYEASLESMDVTSVLSSDGDMYSKAKMNVRNTGKQFLDITLPANSSVWSVYVNNKSVKPALKDEENGIYAIPLVKSTSSDRGGKTFPVEVVYYTDSAIHCPTLGIVSLKALTTELVANTVNWKIYVPEKTGFLTLSAFSNLLEDKKKPCNRSRGCLFNQAKQTMQMTDSMDYAVEQEMLKEEAQMDYLPKSKLGRYYSAPRPQIKQDKYRSKKVGKLPVYVNLPTIGQSFSFYQLSFEADKFPAIKALYANNSIIKLLLTVLLLWVLFNIIKSIKNKTFKSIRFILSALILTLLAYKVIGLNILWLAIISGIIAAFKKGVIKLKKSSFESPAAIIGLVAGVIALIVVSFFVFPKITIGLLVLVIALGVLLGALLAIFKTGQFIFNKFKKDPETNEDSEMEGSN